MESEIPLGGGFGLVIGGGGIVGLSWEVGVLVGLREAAAFEVTDAAVVVGTSAGSSIGSRLLLGQPLDSLLKEQTEPMSAGLITGQGPDVQKLLDVFQLWATPECMTADISQKIGAIALQIEGDESWVELFERRLGTDEWPDKPLLVSGVDCSSGLPVIWSKDDGVSLFRAVAASCCVPGFFPPVEIDGRKYMDGGVWSGSHAGTLVDKGVRSGLFIGPLVGETGVGKVCAAALENEEKALADAGITFGKILPSEKFHSLGMNLMDPSLRGPALEIGLEAGRESKELLSSLIAAARG